MSTHAKLSPSASKRWMNCPGSVQLIDQLIDEGKIEENTTSHWAEEGSAAHALAEKCLNEEKPARAYLNYKIYGDFKVTEEMAEAVQVYLDFIYGCINAADQDFIDTKLEVEVKCSLKPYRIGGLDGGTSDTVLTHEDHCIHVIDYKHGKGVAVDVDENEQLMQYGLGALIRSHKPTSKHLPNVVLTIVQPRAFHSDGPIRSWEISGKDLIKWGSFTLVGAATATHKKDAPIVPGDAQCRWCAAKANCKALYNKTQELAVVDFEEMDQFPKTETLTDNQIMAVIEHAVAFRSFIVAVEQEGRDRFDKGNEEYSKQFKLVKSKTNRKLIENAVDELSFYIDEDKLYNQVVKGIGDIEKALKPDYNKKEIFNIIEEVTTKAEGKTVIAPLSDKRKAILPSIESDFMGLEDDLDDWDL